MATAKAVLRGKFIAIQSHLKKQEKQPNFTPKTTRRRKTTTTTTTKPPKLVE